MISFLVEYCWTLNLHDPVGAVDVLPAAVNSQDL